MAIIPYRGRDPWRALTNLQNEMDRIFSSWFGRELPALREEGVAPSVDISEDKDNIYVEADLPGLEQKDISVRMNDNALVISGKKEETREEKKKNYYRSERYQGSFYRALSLPSSVDTSKIKAKYRNGVLKITLPKKEEEKEKEIDIDVE